MNELYILYIYKIHSHIIHLIVNIIIYVYNIYNTVIPLHLRLLPVQNLD